MARSQSARQAHKQRQYKSEALSDVEIHVKANTERWGEDARAAIVVVVDINFEIRWMRIKGEVRLSSGGQR